VERKQVLEIMRKNGLEIGKNYKKSFDIITNVSYSIGSRRSKNGTVG
jgi:hypothetical protein